MKNCLPILLIVYGLIALLQGCTPLLYTSQDRGMIADLRSKSYPFQVLSATYSKTSKGESLEALQTVHIDETIHVENDGYLILVHFTGKFFDFEGDTAINITDLNNRICLELNIGESKPDYRSYIDWIYGDKPYRYPYRGAVSTHPAPTEIGIMISKPTIEISSNSPKLCLAWFLTDTAEATSKSYIIRIENIFDETLIEISIDKQCLTLDFSSIENDTGLYIVSIQDQQDNSISSGRIGIIPGKELQYFPKECEIQTAIQALEMAYYVETLSLYNTTTNYYQMASALSGRPIYKELLDLYEARKMRYLK